MWNHPPQNKMRAISFIEIRDAIRCDSNGKYLKLPLLANQIFNTTFLTYIQEFTFS